MTHLVDEIVIDSLVQLLARRLDGGEDVSDDALAQEPEHLHQCASGDSLLILAGLNRSAIT